MEATRLRVFFKAAAALDAEWAPRGDRRCETILPIWERGQMADNEIGDEYFYVYVEMEVSSLI